MKLETKVGNRIDSDSGYDNLKLAQDLVTIAEKHYTKQLLIPRVSNSHLWLNDTKYAWIKEIVDKKVFKVNLGDGIEILTYEELRYRFDNLTKKEQDYLNKNARKCTNITDINLDISNVTSYKDVFNAP